MYMQRKNPRIANIFFQRNHKAQRVPLYIHAYYTAELSRQCGPKIDAQINGIKEGAQNRTMKTCPTDF